MQPGGDARLSPERSGGPQGIDECVLNRVGCFVCITESADRYRPEAIAVPTGDFTEGRSVTGNVPGEKVLVGAVVVDGDPSLRVLPNVAECCRMDASSRS